jgi:hypothetical protein
LIYVARQRTSRLVDALGLPPEMAQSIQSAMVAVFIGSFLLGHDSAKAKGDIP